MKLIRNRLYYYIGYNEYTAPHGNIIKFIDSPYVISGGYLFHDQWGKHYILHQDEVKYVIPLYLHILKRKFK